MRGGALRSGGGGTAEVHGWHALEQLWVALGRLLVEVPETAKTVFAFKALFVEKVVTIIQKRNQLFAGANLTNDILVPRGLALRRRWGHDALPRIRPFCTKSSHSRAQQWPKGPKFSGG